MTELDYVVEKVELALNIMATGDGDLKSRLTDAWNKASLEASRPRCQRN